MTTDLKATNYVLFNSYVYQKTKIVNHILRELFGSGMFFPYIVGILLLMTLLLYIGLLTVKEDVHKHQVRNCVKEQFVDYCLICQVAQDFGQSLSIYSGTEWLTIQ